MWILRSWNHLSFKGRTDLIHWCQNLDWLNEADQTWLISVQDSLSVSVSSMTVDRHETWCQRKLTYETWQRIFCICWQTAAGRQHCGAMIHTHDACQFKRYFSNWRKSQFVIQLMKYKKDFTPSSRVRDVSFIRAYKLTHKTPSAVTWLQLSVQTCSDFNLW